MARAAYNRLRRFLPTGGATVLLDEFSVQAIESWTEPAQASGNAKRQRLMSTHYAGNGNKLENSLEAKDRVIQEVLHAAPRFHGHEVGQPSIFAAQSVTWSQVLLLGADEGKPPKVTINRLPHSVADRQASGETVAHLLRLPVGPTTQDPRHLPPGRGG